MTNEEALEIITEVIKDWSRVPNTRFRHIFSALVVSREALQKQIPKKPIVKQDKYRDCFYCPNCNSESIFIDMGDDYVDYPLTHCEDCGQALDWSEVND